VVDKTGQRAPRFGRGDREQPRAVRSDGVEVHPVEIAADLFVDVVFSGLVRGRHAEGRLLLGRRLAVLGVVIPPSPNGFGAGH
jgi:hypothetical protein